MEAFLPDYLDVTTTACDATHARLELAGELDMISCAQLEETLRYHLRRGRRFVSVDISAVTFIDAAAIGTFVSEHQRFLQARGQLILRNAPERVLRLLALVEADRELFLLDERHGWSVAT